jgi:signal transduction histidine kinase
MAVLAQDAHYIDSLKRALSQSKEDTNKVNLYQKIAQPYVYVDPDTALPYAFRALELARKLGFKKGEIRALIIMGEAFAIKGNYPKALEIKLQSLQEAEKLNDSYLIQAGYNYLGALYLRTGDYQKALLYFKKTNYNKYKLGQIGECYFNLNKLDSAYYYIKQAYDLDVKHTEHWNIIYRNMGDIYEKKGNYAKALEFYRRMSEIDNYPNPGMASVLYQMGKQDSAVYFAKKVVEGGFSRTYYPDVLEASSLLTHIYQSNHAFDSAFKYQQLMLAAKDSLFSQDKVKLIQNISLNEQQRQQQLIQERQQAQQQYETKVKLYSLLAGLAVVSLIAFILYRTNQHKQQTNALLAQQKEELQATLEDLQSTQTQLIQKEKMASLGELTAGIAHEIQNPLNFVNNFSEVNKELLEELEGEMDKGNMEEVKLIINDIKENEQKVMLHGRRADSIVKNMLQHSRASSGEGQLTDINALVDEYLRLAYHGLRAKDKDFNANLVTHFDESLPKIEIVPQEIGRVLLNLYNNAFYAVTQKKAMLDGQFQPQVIVATKVTKGRVVISIKDNGTGIPEHVKSKIFQPFFTTKPTGEGTGLGLSLSYDIITKGHGGELKVDSKEGEYAEFTIVIPSIKLSAP